MANKLELTWYGKQDKIKVEPRLLIEKPELSNCANDPDTENMIIHGDNLLALKALEKKYAGKVKCIYIDPPYNTGNAFDKYDDNKEHSIWLDLMYRRCELLYKLLSKDGIMFVNLDEQEHAYAKVMLDSIFGRENYIGDFIWQKRKGGGNDSQFIALDHDYILVYVKSTDKALHPTKWRIKQTEDYLKRYKEIDENGKRYYWDTVARNGLKNPIPITLTCPDGTTLSINSQDGMNTIQQGLENGTVRLKQGKNGWTLHHRVYMGDGKVPRSILGDVGTNKTAGDEMRYLFGNAKAFPYPKPESLIYRLLDLCTSENDLVLDSFLGSGTTCAVAQKMNRRYIGVEMGDHAYTHCKVRQDKVIAGEDSGGITKEVGWLGGGAYKFYELAPTLINSDSFGEPVINKEYSADMLAAAVALHEGYSYCPDESVFWKQSKGNEKSFLFVTTQRITESYLEAIKETMEDGEFLIIACKAFETGLEKRYSNIRIKKIPQMLLSRCEFGRENYDLNIVNPPLYEDEGECEDVE